MSEQVRHQIQITIDIDPKGKMTFSLRGLAAPSEVVYALERIKAKFIRMEEAKGDEAPNIPGMLKGDLSRVRVS